MTRACAAHEARQGIVRPALRFAELLRLSGCAIMRGKLPGRLREVEKKAGIAAGLVAMLLA
jgi:hypothetical protein